MSICDFYVSRHKKVEGKKTKRKSKEKKTKRKSISRVEKGF